MANKAFDTAVTWVRSYLGGTKSEHGWAHRMATRRVYAVFNRLIGFAIPFTHRNRFRVIEIRPGYLKAGIALRGNENHVGAMYAGAMFLLAEIPGGVMTIFEFGPEYVPNLKELTMRYLKPARSDLTVEFSLSEARLGEIRRTADASGKCDFTLEGELRDRAGEVVALSSGHYQVRRRKR